MCTARLVAELLAGFSPTAYIEERRSTWGGGLQCTHRAAHSRSLQEEGSILLDDEFIKGFGDNRLS